MSRKIPEWKAAGIQKALAETDLSMPEIAQEFGVAWQTVNKIKLRKLPHDKEE